MLYQEVVKNLGVFNFNVKKLRSFEFIYTKWSGQKVITFWTSQQLNDTIWAHFPLDTALRKCAKNFTLFG